MKKVIFVLFLLSPTLAVAFDYCKIGENPVDKYRKLANGEIVVPLQEDTLMDVKSKSGHEARCVVKKGEVVVRDHYSGEIKWIKKCGNPAREVLIEDTTTATTDTEEWQMRGVDYNPPAMQDPGMNRAFENCPTGSSCAYNKEIGKWVVIAITGGLVAKALHHHHSGGGGGVTATEPPPPPPPFTPIGGDTIGGGGFVPGGGNSIP